MIVTLTGAFKNAGDYLIGYRARALLRNHVDADVVDINRKQLDAAAYATMNQARAVLLTGGPAYQASIYPGVYNLDLDRINVPVLAYGLGWKGKLGQNPADFSFQPDAAEFVRRIHADPTRFSSARDHLTLEVLANLGVQNVAMTGCPAWYDESKLAQDFTYRPDVKRVVFSMPAVVQSSVPALLRKLAKAFPKAERFLAFNAGFKSTRSKDAGAITRWNYLMAAQGWMQGFRPVSLESDFVGFEKLMTTADFHMGFRVHSHIFALSQRVGSILIAEDSRGVGQQQAMGSPVLSARQPTAELLAAVDEYRDTAGASAAAAVQTMRQTHSEMLRFLRQL